MEKEVVYRNVKIKKENELDSYEKYLFNCSETENFNIPSLKCETHNIETDYSDVKGAINQVYCSEKSLHRDSNTVNRNCRLCAEFIDSTAFNLYDKNALKHKVNFALPISVYLGDGLPELICKKCEQKLQLTYKFVSSVIEAEKELRTTLYQKNLDQNESVSSVSQNVTEEKSSNTNIDTKSSNNTTTLSPFHSPTTYLNNLCSTSIETNYHAENSVPPGNKKIKKQQIEDDHFNEFVGLSSEYKQHGYIFENKSTIDTDLFITDNVDKQTKSSCTANRELICCETCKITFDVHHKYYEHFQNVHDLDKNVNKEDENLKEKCAVICDVCGKQIKHKNYLKMHMASHKELIPGQVMMCKFCKEALPSYESTLKHIADHNRKSNEFIKVTVNLVYICEYCNRNYITKAELAKHKQSHDVRLYSCNFCKAQFSSFARCNSHRTSHLKDNVEDSFPVTRHYVCETCGKSYVQWAYLSIHRRIKHQISDKFRCHQCDEEFASFWLLTYHCKNKHRAKCFTCPESSCNILCATESILRHHIKENHAVPVICHTCGKIFVRSEALLKHKRKFHSNRKKICEICGLTFKSLSVLQSHQQMHLSNNTLCTVCKKKFECRFELHRHMRKSHSGKFRILLNMKEDEVNNEYDKQIVRAENNNQQYTNKNKASKIQISKQNFVQTDHIDVEAKMDENITKNKETYIVMINDHLHFVNSEQNLLLPSENIKYQISNKNLVQINRSIESEMCSAPIIKTNIQSQLLTLTINQNDPFLLQSVPDELQL